MSKRTDDDETLLPFPVAPVSNGEWCPPPITDKQRLAAKLIIEETGAAAKRHGMSRAKFLRTAAATTIAFAVLNKVNGLDQSGEASALPMKKVHCDDPDAARELLDRKDTFIMDVQQHHVDLASPGAANSCFLDFRPDLHPGIPCPQGIGQGQYIKDVFVDSHTTIGVLSGLPYGFPIGPEGMAETRDMVNELAGSERCLSQAVCDPTAPPGTQTSLETMEHQVKELKGRALKCYTYAYGGWRLDDDAGTKMLAEATRLGITLCNTHKGLPAIFAPGSPETVRTIDYPGALKNFPKMRFMAYHSGYFQSGMVPPDGKPGIGEFIDVLESLPKKDRKRMYSEIGSTFAFTFLDSPDSAAHLLGQLLKTLGSRNVIWGTDSVWWGSPQWLIDAFMALQIPASMQEQFGYPPLTMKVKRRILGENAARLYGIKIKQERCDVPADRLEQMQLAQGGARAGRNLRWYGPQTRRGFLAMLRGEWRPRV